MFKEMRIEHARTISDMQSKLIQIERNQVQNVQPRNNNNNRGNNNPQPRRNSPNDQRPPIPLESANVVDQPIPFSRPCESFHEESSCVVARKILDEATKEPINNVSQEGHCTYMISSSFTINNFSDEKDPMTQIYSETPSQEKILEIARSKGHTYQRKCKEQSQNKQVASERYKSGLKVDWAAWINNIKMFVPVLEFLYIPSQRATFFKALGMAQ